MNNFLPKAFDVDISSSYCSDYQYGSNKTPPHWHSGAEIIFVISGKVNIMFNDFWYTLEKNSMIFIPPKHLHCCNCEDATAEKIVLGFKENCLGTGGIGLSLPNEIVQWCIFHNLEKTPLPGLIMDFNEHVISNSIYSEDLMAKSVLLQIYSFLIHYWSSKGIDLSEQSKSETIAAVYKYIEAHYMDALSPYEISKHFNISYSGLAKALQKHSNTTFIKYVNQLRVENAKKLLALTDKSITEIGFECGFSVTSYFIKIFHQLTNMTPKAYRNLINT